jgi:hypothetical protein
MPVQSNNGFPLPPQDADIVPHAIRKRLGLTRRHIPGAPPNSCNQIYDREGGTLISAHRSGTGDGPLMFVERGTDNVLRLIPTPIIEPSADLAAEITIFRKHGGPLTKRLRLDGQGHLTNDGGACFLSRGTAQRRPLGSLTELADLVGHLEPDQAIALGVLRADLSAEVRICTKKAREAGNVPAGAVCRTTDTLTFRSDTAGLTLVDFDSKGMPAETAARLRDAGGFMSALGTVVPELDRCGHITRSSTSAGLYRADTNERLPGSDGRHVYLAVVDASDSERFLKTLHERCWLNGYGWFMVGNAGQFLDRSIVDRMVGRPERLVFEGPPVLEPPLAQDAVARQPLVFEGELLDTIKACPPLTIVERSRLKELQDKAKHALAGEAATKRAAFITARASELAARTNIPLERAKSVTTNQCDGILLPDVVLPFDDEEFAGRTVADVLADPLAFEGATLADPIEGVAYGRDKAKIMLRPDGTPLIHSFAHGRTIYELKFDAAAIQAAIQGSASATVIKDTITLMMRADLDDAEVEDIVRQLKAKTGTGIRPINRMLKAARKAQAQREKEEERRRRATERLDPRPQLNAPFAAAPWLPEMRAYDEVLCEATADVPPSRHIEDELNCARCTVVPGTHAFSSDIEDEPPAPQWHIHKLTEHEAADLLEKHIDFTDPKEGYSVHCPTPYVRHFMQWRDSKLPKLVAISPLPLVLGNGEILAPRGLNRLRGIAFIIDEKLRQCLPSSRLGSNGQDQLQVAAALDFLLNDWLVDVKCPFTDKCSAIALDLTIIERSLLADRPVGFITSPTAESGKTTLAKMLIAAVTGLDAVAFAWSPNEEERRKAIMAYLDAGLMYVLWDNILDGAVIQCPHLERSCTAKYYADRKLGVSEYISASAATVHVFTGNNISPRGAMASRTLSVRVDTDLVDPMARPFVRNNPVAWTKANREEILGALYTILLGNPMLNLPADAPTKTRFPMWYRLVGSAVEHASACYRRAYPHDDKATAVEFDQLFLKQKTSEEEGTSLGEVLDELDTTMHSWFLQPQVTKTAGLAPGEYTAKEIAACLNQDYPPDGVATIRGFLFQKIPLNAKLSPHAVTRALGTFEDRWRVLGTEKLVLRFRVIHQTKVYHVKRALA